MLLPVLGSEVVYVMVYNDDRIPDMQSLFCGEYGILQKKNAKGEIRP